MSQNVSSVAVVIGALRVNREDEHGCRMIRSCSKYMRGSKIFRRGGGGGGSRS